MPGCGVRDLARKTVVSQFRDQLWVEPSERRDPVAERASRPASANGLNDAVQRNPPAVVGQNPELQRRLLVTTCVLIRESLFPDLPEQCRKLVRRKS